MGILIHTSCLAGLAKSLGPYAGHCKTPVELLCYTDYRCSNLSVGLNPKGDGLVGGGAR